MAFLKPLLLVLVIFVLTFVSGYGLGLDSVSRAELPHNNIAPSGFAESPKHPPHHHHHHIKTSLSPTQPPSQQLTPPPSSQPIKAPSPSQQQKPLVKPTPTQPPVKPPSPSPSPSPSPAPSQPLPKRSLVAVQGVVYCKDCKFTGVDTLLNSTPIVGAVVKLQCNNTKNPQVHQATTDKNGYFFLLAPKTLTTFGSHKCKIVLGSSPQPKCNKPTNLHNGLQGASLVPQKQKPDQPPLPFQLFTVGPFAFEPTTKCT